MSVWKGTHPTKQSQAFSCCVYKFCHVKGKGLGSTSSFFRYFCFYYLMGASFIQKLSTNLNIYPTRKMKNSLAWGHQGTMLILPKFLLYLWTYDSTLSHVSRISQMGHPKYMKNVPWGMSRGRLAWPDTREGHTVWVTFSSQNAASSHGTLYAASPWKAQLSPTRTVIKSFSLILNWCNGYFFSPLRLGIGLYKYSWPSLFFSIVS